MTWYEIRQEIAATQPYENFSPHDVVRRAKIATAEQITGIPLIIYAVDFTNVEKAAQYGARLQIDLNDKTGFMQALSDIPDGPLDVLLHSPGGSPSATESIVHLLRARFSPIRFLVPHTAKSAATMLALSGNEILLGEGAELGPIDPQFQIVNQQKQTTVPAGAAISQFQRIHEEIVSNPQKLRGWLPLISQYGPSFLQECQNAIDLSETLVANWLQEYMLHGEQEAKSRAEKVAQWLANHTNFNTHSRPVWIEQLLSIEPALKIREFRDISEDFETAIMSVFWAIDITFDGTSAFKIIEHKMGSAYIRIQHQQLIQQQAVAPPAKPVQRQQPKPQRRKRR